jgi:hypothetical protein
MVAGVANFALFHLTGVIPFYDFQAEWTAVFNLRRQTDLGTFPLGGSRLDL